MAYPTKLLQPEEEIVLDLNPHWKFLFLPTMLLIVGVVVGIVALALQWPSFVNVLLGLVVLVAIGWFIQRFVVWRTTSFVLTTDRCIYRSGVFVTSGVEIPLERINTVFFQQTLFERMLGAGDLAIESGGETGKEYFHDIRNPPEVQHEIYTQMENNENRKYDRIGKEAAEGARAHGAVTAQTGPITVAEQLEKLAELRDKGVLSDEEFETQKANLLR
ncbi:MAG: PH domain-containing protein [Microthrixaceae bacterium]